MDSVKSSSYYVNKYVRSLRTLENTKVGFGSVWTIPLEGACLSITPLCAIHQLSPLRTLENTKMPLRTLENTKVIFQLVQQYGERSEW